MKPHKRRKAEQDARRRKGRKMRTQRVAPAVGGRTLMPHKQMTSCQGPCGTPTCPLVCHEVKWRVLDKLMAHGLAFEAERNARRRKKKKRAKG